jgi:hypothetical protein
MARCTHVTLACTAAACLLAGRVMAADVSTTVLGLLSEEIDQSFAAEFSTQLREAVDARPHLGHTGKDQTLEQVAMAFGCLESLDPMCLQEIGEGLETANLVYGDVKATGDEPPFAFEISVSLFDVVKGKVLKTTTATIPGNKQGSIYLQDAADRIVAELFGEPPRTAVIIQSNVAGATIVLDGKKVGKTGSEPVWLRDVEPGSHEVEVQKEGYETFTETVEVEKGGRVDVDAPLYRTGEEPAPGGEVSPVKGPKVKPDKSKVMLWSGVGVGILGLGLIGAGAGMTAMVSKANDDLADARATTLQGMDVCECFNDGLPTSDCFGSAAWPSGVDRDGVKSACSKGKTGQTAQFVFYGIGGAAAAAGIALVIAALVKKGKARSAPQGEVVDGSAGEQGGEDVEEEEEEEEEEDEEFEEEDARLQVVPWFSPDGGFVSVVGHF